MSLYKCIKNLPNDVTIVSIDLMGLIKELIEFMDMLKRANKQLYTILIVRTEIDTIYFLVCPIKVINNFILQVKTSTD